RPHGVSPSHQIYHHLMRISMSVRTIIGTSGHRRLSAQRHLHDFRRHAETKRHDAAAEAAGNDHVAIEPRVAIGEAIAVTRRHDRRPSEQPDLATMSMSRKLQRDAL